MKTEDCIRRFVAEDPRTRILAVVPTLARRLDVYLADGVGDVEAVAIGDGGLLGRRYDVIVLEGHLSPEAEEWMERSILPRLAPIGSLVTGVQAA